MKTSKSTLGRTVVLMKVVQTPSSCHSESIGDAVEHDFRHVVALSLEFFECLVVVFDNRCQTPSALHLKAPGLCNLSEAAWRGNSQ